MGFYNSLNNKFCNWCCTITPSHPSSSLYDHIYFDTRDMCSKCGRSYSSTPYIKGDPKPTFSENNKRTIMSEVD